MKVSYCMAARYVMRVIFPLAAALLGKTALASTAWVSIQVVSAGTYGNGDVYVVFADSIPQSGCDAARLDIPGSDPDAKNVPATAFSAIAAGLPVKVSAESCYDGYPSLINNDRGGRF